MVWRYNKYAELTDNLRGASWSKHDRQIPLKRRHAFVATPGCPKVAADAATGLFLNLTVFESVAYV
jgi:hypothetical protein